MSGLDILRAIQSVHSAWLDAFFGFMTNLHQVSTYVFVFPLLVWFYDKRFTRYLISVFLLGYWFNGALKDWFNTARPPDDAVRKLYIETGTGPAFPSGHAMNPLMFLGALAKQFRTLWFSILAAAVIFLIGYSRLYAGLHWPIDVVGGWAIGAVLLSLFWLTRRFWSGDTLSAGPNLLAAVVIPLATLVIWRSSDSWSTPTASAGDSWLLAGAYLGFWIGSILEEELVGFDPRRGGWGVQVTKFVLGIGLVFAVKEGFKLFLPHTALGDLIRYFSVALMAALGAPWVFHLVLFSPPMRRSIAR